MPSRATLDQGQDVIGGSGALGTAAAEVTPYDAALAPPSVSNSPLLCPQLQSLTPCKGQATLQPYSGSAEDGARWAPGACQRFSISKSRLGRAEHCHWGEASVSPPPCHYLRGEEWEVWSQAVPQQGSTGRSACQGCRLPRSHWQAGRCPSSSRSSVRTRRRMSDSTSVRTERT